MLNERRSRYDGRRLLVCPEGERQCWRGCGWIKQRDHLHERVGYRLSDDRLPIVGSELIGPGITCIDHGKVHTDFLGELCTSERASFDRPLAAPDREQTEEVINGTRWSVVLHWSHETQHAPQAIFGHGKLTARSIAAGR